MKRGERGQKTAQHFKAMDGKLVDVSPFLTQCDFDLSQDVIRDHRCPPKLLTSVLVSSFDFCEEVSQMVTGLILECGSYTRFCKLRNHFTRTLVTSSARQPKM